MLVNLIIKNVFLFFFYSPTVLEECRHASFSPMWRDIIDLCLRSDRGTPHIPADSFPPEVLPSRDRSYAVCEWFIRQSRWFISSIGPIGECNREVKLSGRNQRGLMGCDCFPLIGGLVRRNDHDVQSLKAWTLLVITQNNCLHKKTYLKQTMKSCWKYKNIVRNGSLWSDVRERSYFPLKYLNLI